MMLTHAPPSVPRLLAEASANHQSRQPRRRSVIQTIIILSMFIFLWIAEPVQLQAQSPVPVANPDLIAGCGLDVILVLDESGSIAGDAQAVRDGARAMLEALVGTHSRVALIEFNAAARFPIGSDYSEVTGGPGGSISPGGVFDLYLNNNYNPDESTNWEDALLKVQQINTNQGVAPLVIFFTDGNPNTYIDPVGNVVSSTETDALNEAVDAANGVKNQGSHLFVVGVSAVTEANLIQIAGPDKQPDSGKSYNETDYTLASFATLKTALRANSFGLCAPSLTVTKQIDQADGQGYVPAADWPFTGTVAVIEPGQAQSDFEWVAPVNGLAATVGQAQRGFTASDGTLLWQWVPGARSNAQPWGSQILLSEENRPDYTFDQADCQRKTLNADGSGFTISDFVLDNLPTAVAVGPVDIVTCTVHNAKTAISVKKTASVASLPEPGGPVDYTFTVTNKGAISVTLTALQDSIFQNLNGQGDCAADGSVKLEPGQTYTCQVTQPITGNAGLVHTNVVTATATTRRGNQVAATDQATVSLSDVPSTLAISDLADHTSVLEPGANVTFTVLIQNTSLVDTVTVAKVISDQFGDISAGCLPPLPVVLAPTNTFLCTFTRFIGGRLGDLTIDKVTASGFDDDNLPVSAFDQEEVIVSDVASSIRVSKIANPLSIPETGGLVTFTVGVENTSLVDSVTITEVLDSLAGDLSPHCDRPLPATLGVNDKLSCTYTQFIQGNAGDLYINTVKARGQDDEGFIVSDQDQATVKLTDVTPDFLVTKSATPTSVLDTGGAVTFTITIVNHSAEDNTLAALIDSVFGNLNGQGTCSTPQLLAGNGGSYQCTFSAVVTGDAKLGHHSIVAATAADHPINQKRTVNKGYPNVIIVESPPRRTHNWSPAPCRRAWVKSSRAMG